jgi:sugar O-acyltransferase (sialic acid O-acetyltransferase NeuD family)
MKYKLLVFGAGGHSRVVANAIKLSGHWDSVGILDRGTSNLSEKICGFPIIGQFSDANRFYSEGTKYAVLAIGDNHERAKLQAHLSQLGYQFPIIKHPNASIEPNANVGDGTLVCAGAIIGSEVKIGINCIINTGAIIDHETYIGNHVHVAPGCTVAGRVHIGERAFLGIGACVREKIIIGQSAIIGAGSVVVKNIPDRAVAYGCPAKIGRFVHN